MNNFKKYLPSKKFISIVLIFVILIAIFFTVKLAISLIFKNKKTTTKGAPTTMIISEINQKDSNSNGIPDYEEWMWGLDPEKDGAGNKEFILAKKKALTESGDIVPADDSQEITENEILSREFFATIMSLQQTGQLDETSIQSVSEALGQSIESIPIDDVYQYKMLTITSDSLASNTAYQDAVGALILKYESENIGDEITLLAQGVGGKDPQAMASTESIAVAYRSFGKELMAIPVPKSLATTHLSLANNYEKTGQTVESLTQMLSDPIIGMRTIINYKNYSDALVSDLAKISEFLQ